MQPHIKKDWLKRAKMHAEADRFIKGEWLNGMVGEYKSGCFFGCMTQCEKNTIEVAAEQMDSPVWIVKLAERIFENLPEKQGASFPVDYLKAIPSKLCADDYESIRHKLGIKRMKRMHDLVSAIETEESYKKECLDAIQLVSDYHENPSEPARSAAESAAESAARSAESAESAAARSAAWSAESAAWSARSAESAAARSAAESAAWSARSAESVAWSDEYIKERDDLFSVFKEMQR